MHNATARQLKDDVPFLSKNSIIDDLKASIIEAKKGETKFENDPHKEVFTEIIKEVRTIIKLVETDKNKKAYKLLDRLHGHVHNLYFTWKRKELNTGNPYMYRRSDTDKDFGCKHMAYANDKIEDAVERFRGRVF